MCVGIIDSVKKYCYSQVIVIANIVMARLDCITFAFSLDPEAIEFAAFVFNIRVCY